VTIKRQAAFKLFDWNENLGNSGIGKVHFYLRVHSKVCIGVTRTKHKAIARNATLSSLNINSLPAGHALTTTGGRVKQVMQGTAHETEPGSREPSTSNGSITVTRSAD